MKRLAFPVIAMAVALASTTAWAQSSPEGNPSDPNSVENRQPGPDAAEPADPATADNEAARIPTAMHHHYRHAPGASHLGYGNSGYGYGYSGSGASTGESGAFEAGPFPRGHRFEEGTEPGEAAQTPTQPPRGFDDE